jgi:hypothetical protein
VRTKNVRCHPWRPLALGAALALSLILLLTVISYAGRHATWQATEFQVLNLEDVPADLTARFYGPVGEEVFSFTHRLSPGQTAYYKPEEMGLAPEFVGTLYVETEQQVAGAVMHVATTTFPGLGGNDVFQMMADDITSTFYIVPYVQRPLSPEDFGSHILVSNLATETAMVAVAIYDAAGVPADTPEFAVPVHGSWMLSLSELGGLPPEFIAGSAVINANQPIRVDIVESTASQWRVYSAPIGESDVLYAPLVPANEPGVVTPTISVRNLSAIDAVVTVCSTDDGSCQESNLALAASTRMVVTSTTASPYTITSNVPVAAVVSAEGVGGSFSYAAGGEEQIGYHLAAPMLFDGYRGFTTTLWVYNTGKVTAAVTVTYVGTEGEARLDLSASIGPDQVEGFEPALGQPHYAALVTADQPILGLVEGSSTTREDGRFAYWATPFVPPTWLVYLPLVIR